MLSSMARPRIHDAATGDRLLATAGELLREGGPDALSVRLVAEAAGASHRAVYALFGSKQGMLDALAAHGYLDLAARVSGVQASDDPACDLVRAGTEGFRGFVLGNPALFRLTFEQVSAEVLLQPRVVSASIASYEALAGWVERLREHGGVHPDRTLIDCCYAFHATCQGLASCELATFAPPAGPGFWKSKAATDLTSTWTDTLYAVVNGFSHQPTSVVS